MDNWYCLFVAAAQIKSWNKKKMFCTHGGGMHGIELL